MVARAKKFGDLLHKYRTEKRMTLRGFSIKVNVSPVYIMDIEKSRRAAPRKEILEKMVKVLGLTDAKQIEEFYDAAARTKKEDFVPGDVKTILKKIDKTVVLMRTIKRKKLDNETVEAIIKDIEDGKYNKRK